MAAMTYLYSFVPVSDRAASLAWYEAFFGRKPDDVIGDEAMWQIGESGFIVIDDRDLRAAGVGHVQLTLAVEGLDEILARLAEHGIWHEPVETYSNGVRHVVVPDPDGNEFSLAEGPTGE